VRYRHTVILFTILDIIRNDVTKSTIIVRLLCVLRKDRSIAKKVELVLNESLGDLTKPGSDENFIVCARENLRDCVHEREFRERDVPMLFFEAFEIARFRVNRIVLRFLRILRLRRAVLHACESRESARAETQMVCVCLYCIEEEKRAKNRMYSVAIRSLAGQVDSSGDTKNVDDKIHVAQFYNFQTICESI